MVHELAGELFAGQGIRMERVGAWLGGFVFAQLIVAAPASAQVHADVGVFTPRVRAHVVSAHGVCTSPSRTTTFNARVSCSNSVSHFNS